MSEPDQSARRAFLLSLRRAKARHRAELRDMEDRLDDLEDEAGHRAHIEAACAIAHDDDEG